MAGAIIADTHAIVWYPSEPTQLSTPALNALDGATRDGDPIYIASITMVELAYLVQKGRLPENNLTALDALLDDVTSMLSLVPLDHGVAHALRQIPRGLVPDMPDRIIAAIGLYLGLPVVTRDPHLQTAPITTIW